MIDVPYDNFQYQFSTQGLFRNPPEYEWKKIVYRIYRRACRGTSLPALAVPRLANFLLRTDKEAL
ncbi:MAG TPA: hypothetical protein DCL61_28575 [Cyanobacteria bacterium UBA12227]|nr:hypothetical protein [Cyanobacteria bacterium UBA12227]HAX85668.1 hypothetical protein [Cyanobacteria bacterium UBA11370]HBY81500.1 hypothetical protein [Cyanobacteria bacterium UBA11148]